MDPMAPLSGDEIPDKKVRKPDLTFVDTEDIVEELIKRYDALVIVGAKFINVNGSYNILKRYGGHPFVMLALLDIVKHEVAHDEAKRFKEQI